MPIIPTTFPGFLADIGFFSYANMTVDALPKKEFIEKINECNRKGDLDSAILYAQKMCILFGLEGFEIYLPLKLKKIRQDKDAGEIIDQDIIKTLTYIMYIEKKIATSDGLSAPEREEYAQMISGVRDDLLALTPNESEKEATRLHAETILPSLPQ